MELTGTEASSENIEGAGGQEVQIEAVQVMVGHQKVSAVDGYLQDIRVITANKELMSKAMLHIEDIIGGASSKEATVVDGEVLVSLIRLFLTEARKSSKASSLSSLSLRLTSVTATLTEDQISLTTQLKSTLNDTIDRMVEEINALEFNIFEVEGDVPSANQITGGSWTATAAMAEETAASLLLHQLKIVSLNTKAASFVATQLESVLATEAGTETTGSLTISGEEYIFFFNSFVQSLETDLAGSSILTLSHSISNVATTLTEEQVTSLTEMGTRLTSIQSQLETFTTKLQTEFESLTGGSATENQILSGSTEETNTDDASKTYLVALQSLMVTRQTITQVENTLMILSSESSLSAGDQISGDEFLLRLSAFFSVFQEDITSTAITALLVTLTRVTVELDEEQKTELTFFKDQLEIVSQRVEIAVTFYQDQFETLAGVTATETQMKTGDPFASLSFMSASKIVKLETLTRNKYLVERVRMLCGDIAEDAMGATSTGTMEMAVEELNQLVMEFFELISQDFLSSTSESSGSESTYANDLVIKIQSAKLTAALTETELTMVEFIVGRLVNLERELEGATHVFLFQYTLITGNSLEIRVNEVPCELPAMMMTTRNPGSMMTTMSSIMMTTMSSMKMTTMSSTMMTTMSSMMATTEPHEMMTTA